MNLLMIGALILVGLLVFSFVNKPKEREISKARSSMIDVKRNQKDNDKIVVIENAPYRLVKQALIDFTANYDNPQQQHLKPILKLHKVTDNKTAVTFPYDIDFEIFCYLVNYLKYPFEIQYSPKIKAWTTTKSSYNWLNSGFEGKKVMLFIDPNDKEYDNVMLTTEDNVQFKIGFAVGEGLQQQSRIIYQFENPDIDENFLRNLEANEIK